MQQTVETFSPSFEFLKLGQFDATYRFRPAVVAHVLKVGAGGLLFNDQSAVAGCCCCCRRRCCGSLIASAAAGCCFGGGRRWQQRQQGDGPAAASPAPLARAGFPCPPSPAAWQSHLVRFNKAGTLDGEVNLELPEIEEREVEVGEPSAWACLTSAWAAMCPLRRAAGTAAVLTPCKSLQCLGARIAN